MILTICTSIIVLTWIDSVLFSDLLLAVPIFNNKCFTGVNKSVLTVFRRFFTIFRKYAFYGVQIVMSRLSVSAGVCTPCFSSYGKYLRILNFCSCCGYILHFSIGTAEHIWSTDFLEGFFFFFFLRFFIVRCLTKQDIC